MGPGGVVSVRPKNHRSDKNTQEETSEEASEGEEEEDESPSLKAV